MTWVRILSWHGVKFTSRGGRLVTHCGLMARVGAVALDQLPGSGKSCETCLRIIARMQDEPEPDSLAL